MGYQIEITRSALESIRQLPSPALSRELKHFIKEIAADPSAVEGHAYGHQLAGRFVDVGRQRYYVAIVFSRSPRLQTITVLQVKAVAS